MKISDYITKYDYIDYYTKQKSMWFYSNGEVLCAINAQVNLTKKQFDWTVNLEDTNEDNDEIGLELYQRILADNQFDNSWLNKNDFDNLNKSDIYLNEFISTVIDFKKQNDISPLMIEGQLIEKYAKQFIFNKFNKNNNFNILDLSEHKNVMIELADKTKAAILENENIIIPQATFINNKLNLATKVDFLIKENDVIYIIENKMTTSSGPKHYLDLLFQYNTIMNNEYIKDFDVKFRLCLIDYERLNKNQVSFCISETINMSKPNLVNKEEFEKRNLKRGIKYNRNSEDVSLYIDYLLDFDEEYFNQDCFKEKRIVDKLAIVMAVNQEFESVITELWTRKNSLTLASVPEKFFPDEKDNSFFGKNVFWNDLKKLYILNDYELFNYSGKFVELKGLKFNKYINSLITNNPFDLGEYFKKSDLLCHFAKSADNFQILNRDVLNEFWNQLKPKKVYFDFETINPTIRALDDTYPFTQVVTQCSILKSNNNVDEECVNLMIDPKKIDVQWIKEIVDGLYEGDDCSYIVYNKSFEQTRLKEMINYIDDPIYTDKIHSIINGLYDLANYFDLNKNMILVKELYGFYSIKKILPLIMKYKNDIFEQTKCKDYKTLPINNGAICQQKSALRFLDAVSDKEWLQIESDSKIYCENDVRAMVAVLYFVDYLINQNGLVDCNNKSIK